MKVVISVNTNKLIYTKYVKCDILPFNKSSLTSFRVYMTFLNPQVPPGCVFSIVYVCCLFYNASWCIRSYYIRFG